MKSLNVNTKRGFTIIEVVLVLAIAGLIFLMVFIALPNMQMSQRNTRRKNDYSSLSTMVTSYVSNNNGKMLQTSSSIKATWLNADGKDPDGEPYTTDGVIKDCAAKSGSDKTCKNMDMTTLGMDRNSKQVFVIRHAECDGATPIYKKGERNFAIYGYMEADTTGAGTTYCLASHG